MISAETLTALEFDRVRRIAAELAVSPLGSERLLALMPYATQEEAEARLRLTAEMVRLLSEGDVPLFGLRDIREDLRIAAVAGAALEAEALLRVASTAATTTAVRAYLAARKNTCPALCDLSRDLADLKDVAEQIERAIAPDGTVRDDASPELRRIRQAMRSESRALEDRMQALMQRWAEKGALQENAVHFRDGRLVLPVKASARSHVKGVIVDQSASGATVFIEPVETLELSNRLRQLELDERREIHRVLVELTSLIHERWHEFHDALRILSELDELYGRARLALRWEGAPPELSARGALRILRGRHPLLIERLHGAEVPLSLELQPPQYALVISGPNAGGKTVVLKTVGLLALMAAAGFFIPAAPGSEIPFFRSVHADIGDAQSIESDLSTFTAHLARLQSMIADEVRPKLVLIDEIGASTDPALGAALAQATLLEFVRQEAMALVTTHHGTLKAFAHETAGIMNGSMSFDEQSLRPTYVFRPGIPGSSYAFEIAERVGFPKPLLETARGFVGSGLLGLEELVSALSRKIEEYEKLRRQSDLKLTEYAALQKLYAERTAQLKKVQAEIKARAAAEAQAIVERTGRDMEAVLRNVKKEKASSQAIKSARAKISAAHEELEATRREAEKELEPESPPLVPLTKVSVGDRVRIADSTETGVVIAVQKGGKRAEVEIGGVRLWMDTAKLYAAPPEEKKRAARVEMKFTLETPLVSDRLDLRGKYGDEALPLIDSYLAAAAEANLKMVTLIHGKGTGALRAKVHEFLNAHPLVKSFHDGGRHSDDFGSTVVELT